LVKAEGRALEQDRKARDAWHRGEADDARRAADKAAFIRRVAAWSRYERSEAKLAAIAKMDEADAAGDLMAYRRAKAERDELQDALGEGGFEPTLAHDAAAKELRDRAAETSDATMKAHYRARADRIKRGDAEDDDVLLKHKAIASATARAGR
jgi:hypothetical protein